MKIKTKKQLNLPQLIEWACVNEINNKIIRADKQLMKIQFDEHGDFRTYGFTSIDTAFTVEVEEKITENTVLPKLVERWKHDDEGDEAFRYVEHDDKSINRVLFANPESVEATHFYIENDNRELVLIWRNGKLVE